MLKPNQQRAIGMLAMGYDVFQVAQACGCDRSTIYRWQQQAEFAAARDTHIREMMTAMNAQIQATSREFIEGCLDAARELRHLVLDPRTPPAVKRAACNDLCRHAGRWYDLMGFNAKLEAAKKLAVDEPDAPNVEAVPDEPCGAPTDGDALTPPPNPLPVDGEGEQGQACAECSGKCDQRDAAKTDKAGDDSARRVPAPGSPPRQRGGVRGGVEPRKSNSPRTPREDLARQERQEALYADPLEKDDSSEDKDSLKSVAECCKNRENAAR